MNYVENKILYHNQLLQISQQFFNLIKQWHFLLLAYLKSLFFNI